MLDETEYDQLSSDMMRLVNDACDSFESCWNSQANSDLRPIQNALNAVPESGEASSPLVRSVLFSQLVQIDLAARSKRGLRLSENQYRDAFSPEFDSVLDQINWPTATGGPIGDTIDVTIDETGKNHTTAGGPPSGAVLTGGMFGDYHLLGCLLYTSPSPRD